MTNVNIYKTYILYKLFIFQRYNIKIMLSKIENIENKNRLITNY